MGSKGRSGVLIAATAITVGLAVLVLAQSFRDSAPGSSATPSPAGSPLSATELAAPGPTRIPSATTPGPATGSVQIALAGDVHFEGFLRARLLDDPVELLTPTAPLLAGADLVVVNLESAVTTRGAAWPKEYNFRAPAEAFAALSAAGVDAVSLANNHTLDYGTIGLLDTLDHAIDAGVATFGAGPDLASALAPHSVAINGHRIALLAAAEVLTSTDWIAADADGDEPARPGLVGGKLHHLDTLLPAVRQAADDHDIVIVYLHWGDENTHCPRDRQTSLVDPLIRAGATIIVGAHPHRLQGFGFVDGALVHYSLGNFVWYTRGGQGGRSESGVLHVHVDSDGTMAPEWRPAEIVDGIPVPVASEDMAAHAARMDDYIGCAGF